MVAEFTLGHEAINTIVKKLKIFYGNFVLVFFSKNDKYSKGAKYMEIMYFAIKEEVQKQRISIDGIRSIDMITYSLNKCTSLEFIKEHIP